VAVAVTTVLPSKATVITSDAPKLAPITVTDVPGGPLAGLREMLAARAITEPAIGNTSTNIIIDNRVARSFVTILALFITLAPPFYSIYYGV
jgi:hypothetical protein